MSKPIKLVSVDGGTLLNTAQFTTDFEKGQVLVQVGARKTVVAESVGAFPEYAGSSEGERKATVNHTIRGNPGSATWRANLDALKTLYRHDKGLRTVIQTRGGVEVEAQYVFEELLPGEAPQTTAFGTWLLQSSILHTTAESTDTESGTTATLTLAVNNTGNVPTRRVAYTIAASVARSGATGHTKGYPITVVNRSRRQVPRWPIDIADDTIGSTVGSYPHATDRAAGDSLASGADLEVWNVRTGKRLNRWFGGTGIGGVNEATTAIWIAETMAPGRYWTTIASNTSGVTAIKVKEPLVNVPSAGWCVVNTTTGEVMRVQSASGRTINVTRASRGTSAATIASGEQLWVASLELWVIIGKDDADTVDTPIYDDDFKPMLLQSAASRSSNHKFYYARFMEQRAAANLIDVKPRAASWRLGLRDQDAEMCDPNRERRTGKGDLFTRYIARTSTVGVDATPATRMILEYSREGAISGHPIVSRWELESPIGIATLDFNHIATEFEFPDVTSDPSPIASPTQRLEVRAEDDDGNDILSASYANPGSTGTKSITYSPAVYLVAFAVHPFDPKVDGAETSQTANEPEGAHSDPVETNDHADVTEVALTFIDADQIVPVWGAVKSIYQFGRPDYPVELRNADGDGIDIYGLIAEVGQDIVVDVEAGTIIIDAADSAPQGAFCKVVGQWPEIPAGASNITLEDTLTPGTWEITATYQSAYN